MEWNLISLAYEYLLYNYTIRTTLYSGWNALSINTYTVLHAESHIIRDITRRSNDSIRSPQHDVVATCKQESCITSVLLRWRYPYKPCVLWILFSTVPGAILYLQRHLMSRIARHFNEMQNVRGDLKFKLKYGLLMQSALCSGQNNCDLDHRKLAVNF